MNYLATLLIFITHFCLLAQNVELKPEKVARIGKIFTNGKLSYYYENDKNGNTLFIKNDGMNGPITMIFVSEYDSLNRETRSFSAHSNIGFSIRETVYETNKISHYTYSYLNEDEHSFDREVLNKINSQQEFLQLIAIKNVLKSKKYLSYFETLDSRKNVVGEYYISEEGDTTSINTHIYNEKNEEIVFHYGEQPVTMANEAWTWDIYYVYDDHSNLIKSYRISSENGLKDTSEVYNYKYNTQNQIIAKNYYHNRTFSNKDEYIYNNENKLIKEYFYESNESKADVKISYTYNKEGEIEKKIIKDYRNSKKEQIVYEVIYW